LNIVSLSTQIVVPKTGFVVLNLTRNNCGISVFSNEYKRHIEIFKMYFIYRYNSDISNTASRWITHTILRNTFSCSLLTLL